MPQLQHYTQGYNTLSGNNFIGLSRLHAITSRQPDELSAPLINAEGVQHYLHYDELAINGETHDFSIAQLGNFVGSMPLVQVKDWLPWHIKATIPRMKIAIRAVKHTHAHKVR
ncbi:unnamed protein product [Ceratitis capitata]|uniref:(Mediterranean fruit fly) hypothetical protein n=1 Tax=Ceratitis capitata TaxID=7213 RepID=A0A811VB87_CERCA|nr:unnamed protein product [Ceratitis capitata]